MLCRSFDCSLTHHVSSCVNACFNISLAGLWLQFSFLLIALKRWRWFSLIYALSCNPELAKLRLTGCIRPADQFNLAHHIPCAFFKLPTVVSSATALAAACHINRTVSGQAVANLALRSKSLATLAVSHTTHRTSNPPLQLWKKIQSPKKRKNLAKLSINSLQSSIGSCCETQLQLNEN